MIFEYLDPVDDQLQVIPVKGFFLQNVPEYIHGGFGRAVHQNDGVALVSQHADLMVNAINLLDQFRFQFVIEFFQYRLLLRFFHDLPDALALGGFQFFLQFRHNFRQMVGRLLSFCNVVGFAAQLRVQLFQHCRRVIHDLADICLQQFVQSSHPDVMARTA